MVAISSDERKQLSEQLGINDDYLYQLLTGRREMDAIEAVRLEIRSGRRLRRWHLRARTWHEIWPELVGMEGAPPVPNETTGGKGVVHGGNVAPGGSTCTSIQTAAGEV